MNRTKDVNHGVGPAETSGELMNLRWTRFLPPFLLKIIDGKHELQRIIDSTGWLFFDKVLRAGLGVFVGVWIARYLGPSRFGLLNYAGAFVTLFATFATMGLDGIVVRNMVHNPSCRDDALGTSFILRILGGMITFVLSMSAIFLMKPDNPMRYWLVAIIGTGTIFQAFDVIEFWFQSQVQSRLMVCAKIAAFILATVVKIAMILLQAPLVAFAWASVVETALGAVGLVLVYQMSGMTVASWNPNYGYARVLLRDSWPIILSGVVGMIYLRIDQVMLGQMVGDKEVGIYSAAVRLAEVWYFIPMAVSASMFPSIIAAKGVSDEVFYRRLQKFYNLMALLGYLVAIPMTFLGEWLVGLLYGPLYAGAGQMLVLLVWAGLFVNLGVARSSFLMTMNWTKVHFMTVALGCVVNVVLNIILIPEYGGMGAVIASIVAYWVAAHASCFVYKPMFHTGTMLTKALLYPKVW